MANFYGIGRTNYFEVKNPEEFLNELSELPCEIITKTVDGKTLYGIMDSNDAGGGLEWQKYDEDSGDYKEIEWLEIFSRHLADESVAVLMETGSEKHRYMVGYAVAVNNKNERVHVSLDDIYELALSELGSKVTPAVY